MISLKINFKALALIGLGSVLVAPRAAQAAQPASGTVLGMTAGDHACYVTLIDDEGQVSTEFASFEICQQGLVGQQIRPTYVSGNILAASCQGDLDCGESETVILIDQAEAIAPPTVATVLRLDAGDRGCYVELVDPNGQMTIQFANPEICNQPIAGKSVQLTYGTGSVSAYACGGDPNCGETEMATLITQANVLTSLTGATRPTISSLPDGNYRYWNGSSNNAVVSDEELLANGGVTFRFRKQGNNITGVFGYVDGEALCVQGQVNGDTVTGISVQNLRGATVQSAGESFTSFGPSGLLQVRRGRQVGRETVRYSSTLLDLTGLNRINAGSVLPPDGC